MTPPEPAPPSFPELTLSRWLELVRSRGYRLTTVEQGMVVLAADQGAGCHPVWRDHVAVKRWQHALRTAVARSHPGWWAFASGQTDELPDTIPMADTDPDAYACAACGGPATTIDGRAIAHCPDHHPSTGWPA